MMVQLHCLLYSSLSVPCIYISLLGSSCFLLYFIQKTFQPYMNASCHICESIAMWLHMFSGAFFLCASSKTNENSACKRLPHFTHIIFIWLFVSHVTNVNVTYWCMWYNSLIYMTWLIDVREMSHLSYVNVPCHIYQWVMSRTSISHVTYINVSYFTWVCKCERWAFNATEAL